MIIATIVLGLLTALLVLQKAHQESAWAKERQNLLERIRDPEHRPVIETVGPSEPMPTDAPEMALTGTILYGDED